jgi:hypothetical protein
MSSTLSHTERENARRLRFVRGYTKIGGGGDWNVGNAPKTISMTFEVRK